MTIAKAPQVEPISNLRREHNAVLSKLEKGPVFLSQHGALTAALVSIELWNETAQTIQDLKAQLAAERRLRITNQIYAGIQADPSKLISQEEYERMLAEAGLDA